jgi:phosphoserine phosphatase
MIYFALPAQTTGRQEITNEPMKSKRTTKSAKTKRKRSSNHILREKATVIIPVLNESRTIAQIVKLAAAHPRVGEVIVVDDGSDDDTPGLAHAQGAKVVLSSMLGKGASLEDGLLQAQHPLVVFLDGDLIGVGSHLIDQMLAPLDSGDSDFVKARFGRSGGRVTVLTARPLLRTYFPEVAHIDQPLGGIVAARRPLLQQLRFENDYGVDVGLLLDAFALRARISEVDIGKIEHDSQTLEALGDMAAQVARTILERAAEHGRLQPGFVRQSFEKDRRIRAMSLDRIVHVAKRADKLALIDMDGTLLQGRFVVALAEATGQTQHLAMLLDHAEIPPDLRGRRIARLFRGVPKETFLRVAKAMPLQNGATDLVVGLHRRGYSVGVVTDSYHLAASIVRRRVFADFAIANVMAFHDDIATGRVTMAKTMAHPSGCKKHETCKRNVIAHLSDRLTLRRGKVVAIGDNRNDICMLEAAGISFAFQPKAPEVAKAADHVIHNSLVEALEWIPHVDGSTG